MDVVGQDVVDLRRDVVFLCLLEHRGVFFRALFADDRDRLRHNEQFQVAFVFALVGIRRLNLQVGVIHIAAALHDKRGTLDLCIGQGLGARYGVGDGQVFGCARHLGRQVDGIIDFRVLAELQPQYIRGFAVERGVIGDGS